MPPLSLSVSALSTALRVMLGSGVAWDQDRGDLIVELVLQAAEEVVDVVPAKAKALLLEVAVRAYSVPAGVASQSTGPFSTTYRQEARAGVYLSDAETARLRALVDGAGTEQGAFTIHPGPRAGRVWDAP